jgi:hypothetical protein
MKQYENMKKYVTNPLVIAVYGHFQGGEIFSKISSKF